MTNVQAPHQPPNMKRCDRHGVLFNEERYNSCAVCRAATDTPKLTISSILLGLLGVTFIGCGLAMAGAPTVMALAQAGDRAIAETALAMRLDPSTIRAEIQALEALVYGFDMEAERRGPAIREAASSLAESIVKLDGAPQPLLDRYSREIEAFGARSDPRRSGDPSSHGYTTSIDWEKVRARVFGDAEWYRHSDTGGGAITDP